MTPRLAFLILAFLLLFAAGGVAAAPWAGVDETVIEKVAEAAGRPAREPLINTDQGDLLLFVFLLAGIAGGFLAGYHFRALFPPRRRPEDPVAAPPGARPLEGRGK